MGVLRRLIPKSLRACVARTHFYRRHVRRPFRETSVNVDHDRRLIFVHIPKTGGTSIKRALGMEGLGDHRTPTALVHPATWEAYFSFMVVRNPFDRLVSSYAYHTGPTYHGAYFQQHPDLKEWGFQEHFRKMRDKSWAIRPQVEYTRHDYSQTRISAVLRFEDLAEDARELFERIGVDAELPHLNPSSRRDARDYYDDPDFLREVVEFYREDFEAWGYPTTPPGAGPDDGAPPTA
jgi:hypothetical protein